MYINPNGQIHCCALPQIRLDGNGPPFASFEFHFVAVITSLSKVFPPFVTEVAFRRKNIPPSQWHAVAKLTVGCLFTKVGLKRRILLMHLKKMMVGLVLKIH